MEMDEPALLELGVWVWEASGMFGFAWFIRQTTGSGVSPAQEKGVA